MAKTDVRTALVTGSCGEGMGRSIALRLAREGCNIVLNYGTHHKGKEMQDSARKIVEAISKQCAAAIVCEADTRDEEQVRAMVDAGRKAFGQIDILVNNAGGDWVIKDLTEIDIEHWRSVLSAEIDGALLTTKHVLAGMRQRKWGRIVHIGMEGVLFTDSAGGLALDYCLGKAARAWLSRAAGRQEIAHNVTVNCVEPGMTPRLSLKDAAALAFGATADPIIGVADPTTGKESWRGRWSQRPGPTSHDIAEAVAYLCSDAARFVTGTSVRFTHFH